MYFSGIDYLRGVLICLVFTGHILEGALTDNILRYVIYLFHMPFFLGINGFLIRGEKLFSLKFKDLISKYFFRMLLPFFIAFAVYTVILNSSNFEDLSLWGLLYQILYPAFHLWYVPALMLMIIASWFFNLLKIKPRIILFLSFLFSLTWFAFFPENSNLYAPVPEQSLLSILGDKRVYVYFGFFYLGFYLRNHTKDIADPKNISLKLSLMTFACVYILAFYIDMPVLVRQTAFLLFNISLVVFSQKYLFGRQFSFGKGLFHKIGQNPLPFYLWHALPIFLFDKIGAKYTVAFYLSSIGFFFFILFLNETFSKSTLYNMMFAGFNPRKNLSDKSI